MYATNFFETSFLNLFLGTSLSAPAHLYLGLFLSDPGETGTGTEVSYTGYARQPLSFTVPAFDNGLQAIAMKNDAQITFPQSDGAAGTITHIGIYDSLTGGNLWAYAAASENLSVEAGETPVVLAGEIVYYLSGSMSAAYKTAFLNVLRGQSLDGVTPYLSLWNGSPENGGAELSGANYARVPLTFAAPSEQVSGQMMIETSEAAAFPRPSTPWGTWTHSAVYTAATGGSPVWVISRAAPYLIKAGYMPMSPAGDIKAYIH